MPADAGRQAGVAQAGRAGARFLLGLPFLGPEQFLPWLGTALLWPLADLLLTRATGMALEPLEVPGVAELRAQRLSGVQLP